MTRRRKWSVGIAVLFGAAWVGVRSRFQPPIVMEGGATKVELTDRRYPPGTELAEVDVAGGERLRGIFVPSDPGAPVVVHLLEARGSVTDGADGSASPPVGGVVRELANLGFASLVLDWRGVGVSEGTRDARHLEGDARAAFEAAVKRAGGDARRVAVRATSLGTIAAAQLIATPERASSEVPAALVLAAPVEGATVTRNYARATYGIAGQWFAAWVYARAGRVGTAEALREFHGPTLVLASADDELCTRDELDAVKAACAGNGARLVDLAPRLTRDPFLEFTRGWADRHHAQLVTTTKAMVPEERAFWSALAMRGDDVPGRAKRLRAALPADVAARIDGDAAAEKRLRELLAALLFARPVDVAAAAFGTGEVESEARWLDYLSVFAPGWPPDSFDFEARAALLDLGDPDGPLPSFPIVRCLAPLSHGALDRRRISQGERLDALLALAHGIGAPGIDRADRAWTASVERALPGAAHADFRELAWSPVLEDASPAPLDAARRALRILLKGASIADRIVKQSDGSIAVQAFDGGSWRTVDPAALLEDDPRNERAAASSAGR